MHACIHGMTWHDMTWHYITLHAYMHYMHYMHYIHIHYIHCIHYIHYIHYIYIYICWRLPEIHGIPCGLCCFRAYFSHTASMQNIDIILCLMALLRLPKTVPKSPSEAYLKDILRNLQCFEPLTETSTNRETLKEHQNNLTPNKH